MPAPFDQAPLAVGDKIPPLTRSVTRTTVFIFNACYYGTHRFHYDVEICNKTVSQSRKEAWQRRSEFSG